MMDEPQTTSIAFFNYAHSYASSALALHRAEVVATHANAPVLFLYFHALELYLKAYLIACGFTEAELREKYGHRVAILAKKAEDRGLELTDSDKQVIDHLARTDNIITARYIRTGLHQRLPVELLHETCYRLHSSIGPAAYEGSGVTRRPVLEPGDMNKLSSMEARLQTSDE